MMKLDLASIEPFGWCQTVNRMVSYGTHHHGMSGVFVFKKYYGTDNHGMSGVFVFKNIMVPTIVE